MGELKISPAGLAREAGLSERTIRHLGFSRGGHRKSTLAAVSAALGWPPGHLLTILRGQMESTVDVRPPGLANLERLLHVEVSALMDDLGAILETVRAIERKVDLLLAREPVTMTCTKEA
jgi:hypothetical protein